MSTVISLKTRDEDLKGSAEARALTSAPRAWTRSERGAGSLEYLGISVVVGVIILTLIAVPWLPQITAGFNNVICRVASNIPGEGISCEEQTPMTEEDFQPRCVLSRDSSTANVNGSVLFIDGENGASMVIEERSNGDYAVTIMDDKGIGASFDLAELEAGPILDVGVGAGAMGRYSEGETFVFDNEDDAIAFAEETQDYVDANGSILEAGGMFHDRPGEDAQPQETRHMVSLDGFIDGVASVGPNVGGKGRRRRTTTTATPPTAATPAIKAVTLMVRVLRDPGRRMRLKAASAGTGCRGWLPTAMSPVKRSMKLTMGKTSTTPPTTRRLSPLRLRAEAMPRRTHSAPETPLSVQEMRP